MNPMIVRTVRGVALLGLALLGLTLLDAGAARAEGYKVGTLVIDNPYALPTAKTATASTVFVSFDNNGPQTVHLLGAATPAAGIVEIQQLDRVGKALKPRRMLVLNVGPGEKLDLTPQGEFRIALIGLKKRLEEGDSFPLTLEFDKLGKVEVAVEVKSDLRVDKGVNRGRGNKLP